MEGERQVIRSPNCIQLAVPPRDPLAEGGPFGLGSNLESAQCDTRPNDLDHAERPSACEESVRAGKQASDPDWLRLKVRAVVSKKVLDTPMRCLGAVLVLALSGRFVSTAPTADTRCPIQNGSTPLQRLDWLAN